MLRLLIVFICFNFILFAKPVSNQKALEIAEKFLSAKSLQNKSIKSIDVFKKNDLDVIYIINYEPKGFVLISADDRIKPLLAFSFYSKFEIKPTNFNSRVF